MHIDQVLTVYQSLVQDNWKRSAATSCHKQHVSSSIRRPEIKGRQISLCFKKRHLSFSLAREDLCQSSRNLPTVSRVVFPCSFLLNLSSINSFFSQFFITPPFFCFRLWFRACYEENNKRPLLNERNLTTSPSRQRVQVVSPWAINYFSVLLHERSITRVISKHADRKWTLLS